VVSNKWCALAESPECMDFSQFVVTKSVQLQIVSNEWCALAESQKCKDWFLGHKVDWIYGFFAIGRDKSLYTEW
jgi:hypothetical protein